MASYQNIDVRLKTLEDMVIFLMEALRMRGAVPTGIVNPDGTPAYRQIDGNMLEFYRMSRQMPTQLQSDAEPPVLSEEPSND